MAEAETGSGQGRVLRGGALRLSGPPVGAGRRHHPRPPRRQQRRPVPPRPPRPRARELPVPRPCDWETEAAASPGALGGTQPDAVHPLNLPSTLPTFAWQLQAAGLL